jgi:hypothetical protein
LLASCFALLLSATAAAAPQVRWLTLKSSRPGLYDIRARYPELKGPGPVTALANREFRSEAESEAGSVRQAALGDRKLGAQRFGPYELRLSTHLSVVDDELVTGYLASDSFTGGAHGNAHYLPLNFGIVGGRAVKLRLKDLLRPEVDPVRFYSDATLPGLNQQKRAREASPVDEVPPQLVDRFVITRAGITWIFAPYDVGAYAEGAYFVKVPWEQMEGSLRTAGPLQRLRGMGVAVPDGG